MTDRRTKGERRVDPDPAVDEGTLLVVLDSDAAILEDLASGTERGSNGPWSLIGLACVVGVLVVGVMWGLVSEDRSDIGMASLVVMIALLLLGAPVGAAMLCAGAYGLWVMGGMDGTRAALGTLPYVQTASWSLSVIPMFILMGFVLWRTGATERLFGVARTWLRWLPGNLAITTNVSGAALSAVTGSTLAIVYALGRISIPEMLRAGYDKRLALGAVLMSGTSGNLIPPGILMVIYAGIAQVPVGDQLLAGIVPGVLLTLMYTPIMIVLYLITTRRGSGRISSTEPTKRDHVSASFVPYTVTESLGAVWPFLAVIGVIVGGLYGGFFTATEAGAFGALVAIIVSVRYVSGIRQYFRTLQNALVETAIATSAVMFLLMGAIVLNRMLVISGLTADLTSWVATLEISRIQFLVVVALFYLVLGMFMEGTTMMVLTVPLLLPVVGIMDIDPVWFGVYVVFLGELAAITPPVGVVSFVVHRLAQSPEVNLGQKLRLWDVYQGLLWFLPVAVLMMAILIAFPDLPMILVPER